MNRVRLSKKVPFVLRRDIYFNSDHKIFTQAVVFIGIKPNKVRTYSLLAELFSL